LVITRPTADGSATATFAAKLAALPTTRRVHGRKPLRRPLRESACNVIDDAAIIPSTETGSRAAVHDVSPYSRTKVNMCLYDNTAAIPASTTTLTVVVHRIARSPQEACAFAMIAHPSSPSTREVTSRGTCPSGMTMDGELVEVPPRTHSSYIAGCFRAFQSAPRCMVCT
jgi:hypothetical protein